MADDKEKQAQRLRQGQILERIYRKIDTEEPPDHAEAEALRKRIRELEAELNIENPREYEEDEPLPRHVRESEAEVKEDPRDYAEAREPNQTVYKAAKEDKPLSKIIDELETELNIESPQVPPDSERIVRALRESQAALATLADEIRRQVSLKGHFRALSQMIGIDIPPCRILSPQGEAVDISIDDAGIMWSRVLANEESGETYGSHSNLKEGVRMSSGDTKKKSSFHDSVSLSVSS
jgi:hypothetical protein